jgi:hypothetical protein
MIGLWMVLGRIGRMIERQYRYLSARTSLYKWRDLLATLGHESEGGFGFFMPVTPDEGMGEMLISNWLDMLSSQHRSGRSDSDLPGC